MRIVYTIGGLSPAGGGPARSAMQFCDALAGEKTAVEVLGFDTDEEQGPLISAASPDVKVQILDCRKRSWHGLRETSKLESFLLAQLSGDTKAIVHDNGVWNWHNHLVVSCASSLGVPVLISPRGSLMAWAMKYHKWKKMAGWWLYQKSDVGKASAMHVTSEDEARELRDLGVRVPLVVVPHGVVPPVTDEQLPSACREKSFVFLSRIHPKKGLLNLISAWAETKQPGWELIIAGPDEGGHEESCRRHVCSCNVEESVKFLGPVYEGQKERLLRTAGFLVLPTMSENFGLVVAEALSYGVPVITTKGAPWSDLVKYRCGWWIDIGVEPLKNAIRAAMSVGDEERTAMGIRAREMIMEKYTWKEAARQMIRVYEWLLGEGTCPGSVLLS